MNQKEMNLWTFIIMINIYTHMYTNAHRFPWFPDQVIEPDPQPDILVENLTAFLKNSVIIAWYGHENEMFPVAHFSTFKLWNRLEDLLHHYSEFSYIILKGLHDTNPNVTRHVLSFWPISVSNFLLKSLFFSSFRLLYYLLFPKSTRGIYDN